MPHPMEPACFDQATPRERGHAHGELWREEIAELASMRTELALRFGHCGNIEQLELLAAAHLPVMEREAPDLYEELCGIAEGAAIDLVALVVVNHYTDLRDIVPPKADARADARADPDKAAEPDGCTAIYCPTPTGPILAQTWDMHASAEPFVRVIRIEPPGGGPKQLCFTLTGCLGMVGMNDRGVAVTINNLSSTDARVGLLWPAVVRRLLACEDAPAAARMFESLPLSSGHHYMIADGIEFYGYESSGELKVLTQLGPKAAHIHTNHCFDPVLRQREAVPSRSTTFQRMNMATTLYVQRPPKTMDAVWALLGSHDGYPRSVCSHAHEIDDDPHGSKTCGRIAMALEQGHVRVSQGCGERDAGIDIHLGRVSPRSKDD